MSVARREFLSRLSLLRLCLAENALIDGLPTQVEKNGVAAVLRNGLAVLTYTTLEEFIRSRSSEILKSFNPATVNFTALPEKLKIAVTIGALRGLMFRYKYEDPINQVPWVLSKLPPITSAATNVASLSELSFANESSNVSVDAVKEILSAFGVHGGWECITNLSKRVGLGGVPDYRAAFEEVAKRRHAAAHNVAAQTQYNDLASSLNAVLGIGICFDLLLSEACSRLNAGIPIPVKPITLDSQIGLMFVSPHPQAPGKFREQVEHSKSPQRLRSVRVHLTVAAARAAVAAKYAVRRQHFVEWNATGTPADWSTW